MTGRLVARHDLMQSETAEMRRLLSDHFIGVTAKSFDSDLEEKNWVVLIEHAGAIVGFSTLQVTERTVAGELIVVIYSGDTIVSPAVWGSAIFPRVWITAVYSLRTSYPNGRLIWLLLTSGYRTYRFLPVFWKTFYPRVDALTPARWKRLMDTLAAQRFGTRFNSKSGVVRFEHPQQLRGVLAEVPVARRTDQNVAFFLDRNPGHGNGDELVCIADLDPAQLTRCGRRVVYGAAR